MNINNIKELIREYKGLFHDNYMVRLHKPCEDIEQLKQALYSYCKINKIDTYMGIDYLQAYKGFTTYDFKIIKD